MRCTPTGDRAAGARTNAHYPEGSIRRSARPRIAFLVFALICAGIAPEPARAQEDRGPEPTLWGGVEYFARATLSDAWAVTTAAVDPHRSDWLALAGVTAVGLALVPFDYDIWRHSQERRELPGYSHVEGVAKVFEPFALQGRMNKYYLGGVVVGYVIDGVWEVDRPRHIFEELLIANLISATTRKTIGRAIGRFRPSTGEDQYHFEFWDGMSFPSGHVANIATLATVLGHHIDFWPVDVLLWGAVGTVLYERVADSGHWPSDSWFGVFWGHAIAKIVIERREADHVRFGPVPAPASAEIRGIPFGFQIRF